MPKAKPTMHRTFFIAGVVALTAAGCGSTVQGTSSTVASGNQTGQGLSVPGSTTGPGGSVTGGTTTGSGTLGGSTVGPGSGSTSGGTVPGTGPTAGSGGGVGAPGVGGSSSSSSAGANGPGVTATTISLGYLYDPDVAAADSAIGASNLNPGDTKAETDAVIKYLNQHGGVAGRQLSAVWHKATVNQSANTTYQQACSDWTQDHKVFVMEPGDPIVDQCAMQAHILNAYTGGITVGSTPQNNKYPVDVDITGMTNDRAMKVTVEGLAKQGYFANGAKVGIATWDDPTFSWSISHAALPALAKVGIHNPPVAYISPPQSYGELGATSASVSSAVLNFQSKGIDHVLLFDGAVGINSAGTLVLEWMNQAQSQHYTPRYGLNSTSGFSTLAPDVPKQQMVGSIGVGWVPVTDVPPADYPPSKLPPSGRLCLQIMQQAGQPSSGTNQEALALAICDKLFFLKQAFDRIHGPINQQTGLAAINAVGGAFRPSMTFGTFLSAQQHDGVSLVRNAAFDPSCTCYHYTSAPYSPR